MKTYISKHSLEHYRSNIFDIYFHDMNPAILDIETTGLSFKNSNIVLVGLLVPVDCGIEVTQFLAESPDDEANILESCLEFMRDKEIDYLITFNGGSFDVPFFNSRLSENSITAKLDMYNYDLYKTIRYCSDIPSIVSPLTERNLESYMGIDELRDDSRDGRDCAKLYYEYLRTKNSDLLNLIIRHNLYDLLQLYRLLDLNRYVDLHRAMYKFGLPVRKIAPNIKPYISKNSLVIKGRLISCSNDLIVFPVLPHDPYICVCKDDLSLEVRVPLLERGNSLYIDLGNYELDHVLSDKLSIESLDGYVSDYLILVSEGDKKYREINSLSILMVDMIDNIYDL